MQAAYRIAVVLSERCKLGKSGLRKARLKTGSLATAKRPA